MLGDILMEDWRLAIGVGFKCLLKSPGKTRWWVWQIFPGPYQPLFWMFPVKWVELITSSAKQHLPKRSEEKGEIEKSWKEERLILASWLQFHKVRSPQAGQGRASSWAPGEGPPTQRPGFSVATQREGHVMASCSPTGGFYIRVYATIQVLASGSGQHGKVQTGMQSGWEVGAPKRALSWSSFNKPCSPVQALLALNEELWTVCLVWTP